MWTWIVIYTIGTGALNTWIYRYWNEKGQGVENGCLSAGCLLPGSLLLHSWRDLNFRSPIKRCSHPGTHEGAGQSTATPLLAVLPPERRRRPAHWTRAVLFSKTSTQ
ncbi:hypothetical protein [Paenibacillus roseipurpureus]|uniref:Uncharacterized protein n=1 Tax=Paenibacillus roseopurpureus TaxID=2918901 RepID=A0AA96LLA0_9BACL|nr:hypothetical protein [Paenibacillus sp. MBLB1832]WNR43049.1 hypothetical protein MJB10_18280 [Paenibacillus sp. MBLB1832]